MEHMAQCKIVMGEKHESLKIINQICSLTNNEVDFAEYTGQVLFIYI